MDVCYPFPHNSSRIRRGFPPIDLSRYKVTKGGAKLHPVISLVVGHPPSSVPQSLNQKRSHAGIRDLIRMNTYVHTFLPTYTYAI